MRGRLVSAAIVSFCAAICPPDALGQAASPPASESVVPRWEIEAYGGLSLGRFSRGGTASLPMPGPAITTSSPTFPSWSVPSWFFGDGAAFLNNVAAEFGIQNRISPLDAVLRPLGVNDAGHFLAGVRVKAPLPASYSLELGLELSAQPAGLSNELLDALMATSASFQATFSELLATGPFTAPNVTSGSTASAGSSRDLLLTAALIGPGPAFGTFTSYGVAGGGVIVSVGDAMSAGLVGRYRFVIGGAAPVDETDLLTVRYRERTSFVALLGGGIRRPISNRMGFNLDARLLIGPQSTAVEVDAAPSVVSATPAGFIESFTYPNLQFSNNTSTGRRSTLGGPSLDGVGVFEGGWMLRPRVTAGVYFRF